MALIWIFFFNLLLGCYAGQLDEHIDFFSNVDHPSRIVGGFAVVPGAHPHQAALTSGLFIRSFFCGGSVISTRTVLTAAHCIDTVYHFGFLTRTLRVVVGTTQWYQGGMYYSVLGNVTHRHWNPGTVKNDIGILHTTSAIEYNDFVKAIPLNFDYVNGGVKAKAAGWGKASVYGPISTQLLELVVTTLSASQCAGDVLQANTVLNMASPPYDPRTEICTLHPAGRGMCRGDSGGALTRLDSGTQVGVISWGFPCARSAPDVSVRISAYEAWIQKNIRF